LVLICCWKKCFISEHTWVKLSLTMFVSLTLSPPTQAGTHTNSLSMTLHFFTYCHIKLSLSLFSTREFYNYLSLSLTLTHTHTLECRRLYWWTISRQVPSSFVRGVRVQKKREREGGKRHFCLPSFLIWVGDSIFYFLFSCEHIFKISRSQWKHSDKQLNLGSLAW
jgi:hypothetical protein